MLREPLELSNKARENKWRITKRAQVCSPAQANLTNSSQVSKFIEFLGKEGLKYQLSFCGCISGIWRHLKVAQYNKRLVDMTRSES